MMMSTTTRSKVTGDVDVDVDVDVNINININLRLAVHQQQLQVRTNIFAVMCVICCFLCTTVSSADSNDGLLLDHAFKQDDTGLSQHREEGDSVDPADYGLRLIGESVKCDIFGAFRADAYSAGKNNTLRECKDRCAQQTSCSYVHYGSKLGACQMFRLCPLLLRQDANLWEIYRLAEPLDSTDVVGLAPPTSDPQLFDDVDSTSSSPTTKSPADTIAPQATGGVNVIDGSGSGIGGGGKTDQIETNLVTETATTTTPAPTIPFIPTDPPTSSRPTPWFAPQYTAETCVDQNQLCDDWHAIGYCTQGVASRDDITYFIWRTCPKACGWCSTTPTSVPSNPPSVTPTVAPSVDPTSPYPTKLPTLAPTKRVPTPSPTLACIDNNPLCVSWGLGGYCRNGDISDYVTANCRKSCGLCVSSMPTISPTVAPLTSKPSTFPSWEPTPAPSPSPSTTPTHRPTAPSLSPSVQPTSPPTITPTKVPTTLHPTLSPHKQPVCPFTGTALLPNILSAGECTGFKTAGLCKFSSVSANCNTSCCFETTTPPTTDPTVAPSTNVPTFSPTTSAPTTNVPTFSPTTSAPTTANPTIAPTNPSPTPAPTIPEEIFLANINSISWTADNIVIRAVFSSSFNDNLVFMVKLKTSVTEITVGSAKQALPSKSTETSSLVLMIPLTPRSLDFTQRYTLIAYIMPSSSQKYSNRISSAKMYDIPISNIPGTLSPTPHPSTPPTSSSPTMSPQYVCAVRSNVRVVFVVDLGPTVVPELDSVKLFLAEAATLLLSSDRIQLSLVTVKDLNEQTSILASGNQVLSEIGALTDPNAYRTNHITTQQEKSSSTSVGRALYQLRAHESTSMTRFVVVTSGHTFENRTILSHRLDLIHQNPLAEVFAVAVGNHIDNQVLGMLSGNQSKVTKLERGAAVENAIEFSRLFLCITPNTTAPTASPTTPEPTSLPTIFPTTSLPTMATTAPTSSPSGSPMTSAPTANPLTSMPTAMPSEQVTSTLTTTLTTTVTTTAGSPTTSTPVETSLCANSPSDWINTEFEDCSVYEDFEYCTSNGGPGDGWSESWGSLSEYVSNEGLSALDACCACGGGIATSISSAPTPSVRPSTSTGVSTSTSSPVTSTPTILPTTPVPTILPTLVPTPAPATAETTVSSKTSKTMTTLTSTTSKTPTSSTSTSTSTAVTTTSTPLPTSTSTLEMETITETMPLVVPSFLPSVSPTNLPTVIPTSHRSTEMPPLTSFPTPDPSRHLSMAPTVTPTINTPTISPTLFPTTSFPTPSPSSPPLSAVISNSTTSNSITQTGSTSTPEITKNDDNKSTPSLSVATTPRTTLTTTLTSTATTSMTTSTVESITQTTSPTVTTPTTTVTSTLTSTATTSMTTTTLESTTQNRILPTVNPDGSSQSNQTSTTTTMVIVLVFSFILVSVCTIIACITCRRKPEPDKLSRRGTGEEDVVVNDMVEDFNFTTSNSLHNGEFESNMHDRQPSMRENFMKMVRKRELTGSQVLINFFGKRDSCTDEDEVFEHPTRCVDSMEEEDLYDLDQNMRLGFKLDSESSCEDDWNYATSVAPRSGTNNRNIMSDFHTKPKNSFDEGLLAYLQDNFDVDKSLNHPVTRETTEFTPPTWSNHTDTPTNTPTAAPTMKLDIPTPDDDDDDDDDVPTTKLNTLSVSERRYMEGYMDVDRSQTGFQVGNVRARGELDVSEEDF